MALVAKNLPPFPPIPDLSPEVQAYLRDVAVYIETNLKPHDPNLTSGADPGHTHTFGVTATLHAPVHELGGADPVSHDELTDFVAAEHYNHTAISVIAGTNLNGGGAITANRTLNLDANPSVTSLIAGTLTVAAGSITDSGGTISFGNENLTSTGTITGGILKASVGAVDILDATSETYYMRISHTGTALTALRRLKWDLGNADRTITLEGNVSHLSDTPTFDQIYIEDSTKNLIYLSSNDLYIENLVNGADIRLDTVNGAVLVASDIGIGADKDLLQLAANTLTVNGSIYLSSNIIRSTDTDTGIFFTTDAFHLQAGNLNMLNIVEAAFGSDEVVVNENGVDIDFRVEAVGQANALFVQGSDGAVDVATNFTAGTIQADNGFTGTWVNNEGDTVTVVGGVITGVAP